MLRGRKRRSMHSGHGYLHTHPDLDVCLPHLTLVQRIAKHDGSPARLAVKHAHHAGRQAARPAGVVQVVQVQLRGRM